MQKSSDRPRDPSVWRRRFAVIPEALVLGAFLGLTGSQTGVWDVLRLPDPLLLPVLLAILLALMRPRLLRLFAGAGLVLLLVVGYSPLAGILVKTVVRADRIRPCAAVVVLSSNANRDGSLSASEQARLAHAYALLSSGQAPRLVMTTAAMPSGAQAPAARRQMAELRLNYPMDVTGEVHDTHDEAVATAELARARGWKQVILVSNPWHLRRAGATFERCGLKVLCSPCVEGEYDMGNLNGPGSRLHAFRDWLHEWVGYHVYRFRNWI